MFTAFAFVVCIIAGIVLMICDALEYDSKTLCVYCDACDKYHDIYYGYTPNTIKRRADGMYYSITAN